MAIPVILGLAAPAQAAQPLAAPARAAQPLAAPARAAQTLATPARAADPAVSCGSLASARLPEASVTSAAVITVQLRQPTSMCEVKGVIRPATHFTVRLPVSGWTGQYVQVGCGGLCGAVPGLDLPPVGFSCAAALDGHLVVAADDTGHTASGPATWGGDNRARLEFGLLSEHRLRYVADAVMKAYFGRGPAHRYFDGCSTGGRQALNLAQRFPGDFDGLLAGAPANNLAPLALLNAWNVTRNIDAAGRQILGSGKLPALHAAVVKACGEVIQDPRRCGFQPSSMLCRAGRDTPACLTPAQVATVTDFYRGPRGLYNGGMPYGSELGWRGAFVVDSGSPLDGPTAAIALDWFRYLGFARVQPDFQLSDVRFDTATFDRLNRLGDAIYNANNPDLSAFRARGGKIILYHGWADPSIPPFSTVDYYAAVQKRGGSQSYARLYMIPAGYHCLFGPEASTTPSEIGVPEFLQPLMDWVERGTAPGVVNVPTVDAKFQVIRDLDVEPFDALAPVRPAPGSLNAGYHYVGGY
ncbi:tannase/feruloyl esterase family alpha/beta hydrolase [Actinoplanes bogorensis]|uniref:Tannase/feruloyl esterase family alpha/beta hydrolase n=2 Tax=Paractinoplanes bogorensis TaxID=1610840 RepID=A0ABS5YSL6_9ACTN|nr:tannase/feruloyl esterase family alpha/beta hydrolase [Actinoplanes bogorensis]